MTALALPTESGELIRYELSADGPAFAPPARPPRSRV